jgi:hypothetical protein
MNNLLILLDTGTVTYSRPHFSQPLNPKGTQRRSHQPPHRPCLPFSLSCRTLCHMPRENKQPRRSAILSFRFLGTALAGSLVMALVSIFAPPAAQIAVLGAFVSILGGLFLSYLAQDDQREKQRSESIEHLSVPLALAPDRELYERYLAICHGLTELTGNDDPILRQIALLKLTSIVGQIEAVAGGTVVFSQTESWRTVYEQLLRSKDVREYRSVAWVKTPDYWQDAPGRQSMQVNFEAVHRGMLIERVIILPDKLWPREQLLPLSDILPWIEEQHNHGLWITVVRTSELSREPDLLCDFGIYGHRGVGVQEIDEHSRTLRFTLEFSPQAVQMAEDRWRRIGLYAVSLRSLLDRLPPGA